MLNIVQRNLPNVSMKLILQIASRRDTLIKVRDGRRMVRRMQRYASQRVASREMLKEVGCGSATPPPGDGGGANNRQIDANEGGGGGGGGGGGSGGGGSSEGVLGCGGCGREIAERWYLRAADRAWHCGCLRCCHCRVPLAAELTCFARDGNIYCKEDYYRLACEITSERKIILLEEDKKDF